ncbi:MAG: DNA-processing protein DprA [Bdellovibrionales bacterium]|nr:DNA-processing protein DprA [Bdellovibrionales bacterium]
MEERFSPTTRFITLDEHSERLRSRADFFRSRLPGQRLLVRGPAQRNDFARPAVAIIGTRRPTSYGLRFVASLVPQLKSLGCTVLSGGALGIDGQVHVSALRAGIPTQAWLVGPVASPSPRSHAHIFEALSQRSGCALIVPESLEPTAARGVARQDWVTRNSWLVAACDALIVVEAQLQSGTSTSVDAAAELGIPTYVLPGPVDSVQSEGTNQMISRGSGRPIQSVKGLIESLIVDLGTSFYNESRIPEWTPGEGGDSTDLSHHKTPSQAMSSLCLKLSNSNGLSWNDVMDLARQYPESVEEIINYLQGLAERGELKGVGNHFERRG